MSKIEHSCPKEELPLLSNGKLKAGERVKIEQHLRECSVCREYLDFIRGLKQAMKDLPEPEKEPCPSSLILSLYAGDDLDKETAAHVGAHILHCDDCANELSLLGRMEDAIMKKDEKPSTIEPFYKLAVRFIRNTIEVLEATGEVFQGRELAFAKLRGPKREYERKFVVMSQSVNEDLSIDLRVDHTEIGKHAVSLFAYHTTLKKEKRGISGLDISFRPENTQSSITETTPVNGIVELGEWDEGTFLIEINDVSGKKAEVLLDLRRKLGKDY
ncbi:MAG: hypothetical protein JRJ03_00165 [Deltaproteobacteria bacterium]|nr:hypothetical protein [Deltaproteobacteria bacterium]